MDEPLHAMIAAEKRFGRITFAGKDLPPQPARFDRLAIGQKKTLLLVSIVAEANFVKSIRSILGGGARADIKAWGAKVFRPGDRYSSPFEPDEVFKTEELYDFHTQKLDHGLVHAMFITRTEGFMLVVNDDALWRELSDTRYTTPILREWLPYIRSELERLELLKLAYCFGCRSGMLAAKTEDLDAIVATGLRRGDLLIPRPGSILDPAA